MPEGPDKMRGWAVVCAWTHEYMISRRGRLKQLPNLYDREFCERVVAGLNTKQALGPSDPYDRVFGGYYVALPYPVILDTPLPLQRP